MHRSKYRYSERGQEAGVAWGALRVWRPPPGRDACAGAGAPMGFARFAMFVCLFVCSLCEYTGWHPSGGRRRAARFTCFLYGHPHSKPAWPAAQQARGRSARSTSGRWSLTASRTSSSRPGNGPVIVRQIARALFGQFIEALIAAFVGETPGMGMYQGCQWLALTTGVVAPVWPANA